jgi:hypothetical protein
VKVGIGLLVATAVLLVAVPAGAVVGDWRTDPEEALARAAKEGKPILAVAMDHG